MKYCCCCRCCFVVGSHKLTFKVCLRILKLRDVVIFVDFVAVVVAVVVIVVVIVVIIVVVYFRNLPLKFG